jgi:hypothetical protein
MRRALRWIGRCFQGGASCPPKVGTGLAVCVAGAILAGLLWAFPMLAVFAAFAVPAGAIVGIVLIVSRGGIDEFLIVLRKEKLELTQPEVNAPLSATTPLAFGERGRFAALFELRYHPVCGNHPDKALRTKVFRQFWAEVEIGTLDGFAVCDQVRNSRLFTQTQCTALVKDIMVLAFAAVEQR